jgi:hypothetical protein
MSKKQSVSPVPEVSATPAPTVRIIKVGTCKSLSGKSNLSYHVGHVIADAEDSEAAPVDSIMFRIHSNSSAGFFNSQWIGLASITKELDKVPSSHGIVSFSLFSLYKGSTNSPGFLLAALLNEGLVTHLPEKKRSYGRLPDAGFIAEMVKLIDAGVDLRGDAKSAQGKTISEKSASKKSKAAAVPVDVVPAMPDDASQEQSEK